jgi:uncharacterized membrane protein
MSITTTATRVVSRRATDRLDLPAASRVPLLPRSVNREALTRGAERIARFLGTGRYLAIQTVLVFVWIGLNVAIPIMRWDPYPFILLNLAFSTQAAYAAPLILLAQNRQDDRDRASLAEDRAAALRTREDTEFLAREVAALRLAQSDAATRQYLRGELSHQLEALRDDLRVLVLDAVRASLGASSGAAGPAGSELPVPAREARVGAPAAALGDGVAGQQLTGELERPASGRRARGSTAARSAGGPRAGGERRRAPDGPPAGAAMFSPACRHPGDVPGRTGDLD